MKRTVRMVIEVVYDDDLCDAPETPETWETDPREWGDETSVRVVEVLDPEVF